MMRRHDDIDARRRRMQPIGQIEFGIARYAIEKERIQIDPIGCGQRRKDAIEVPHIVRTHVARRIHAGEQDGDMAFLQLAQDGIERCLGQLGVKPAQGVIAAQFEYHRFGTLGHRPVKPIEPAGRGIAGHPGIGHGHRDALGFERLRQLGRERRLGRQTVTGAERIAQHHHFHRPVGGRRRAAPHRDQANCRKPLDPGDKCPI